MDTPQLESLHNPPMHQAQAKPNSKYVMLQNLLDDLAGRGLTKHIIVQINEQLVALNEQETNYKAWKKQLGKSLTSILNLLEKELSLVPKNHYRNQWMAIGMSAFGIPMGAAFGLALDNMAFIGIGLPLGLTIGMAVGSQKDKQAATEGRQLNFDIG